MTMRLSFLVFALPVVLWGCASTQSITATDKAAVKAVAVSKDVAVAPHLYYLGASTAPGMALGAIGGAVGGAIAGAVMAPKIEQERAALQQQWAQDATTIDVIVREEVTAQLRASGKLALAQEGAADSGTATAHMTILTYGFSIPHGFSQNLVPILSLRIDLKAPDGRVVWSTTDHALPLGNPVDSVPEQEVRGSAAVREKAWREAARAMAGRMIERY